MSKLPTEKQKQERRKLRKEFYHQLLKRYKLGDNVVHSVHNEVGKIMNIIIDDKSHKPYFIIFLSQGGTRIAAGGHIQKYRIL